PAGRTRRCGRRRGVIRFRDSKLTGATPLLRGRSPAEVIRMEYDVRLEQRSSRPLAVVRRRASSQELSRVVPDACGAVWNVVRAQQIPGAGRHIAVYLDCQINLEVGVELDAPFAGHGEVVGSATPAGTVATTVHL